MPSCGFSPERQPSSGRQLPLEPLLPKCLKEHQCDTIRKIERARGLGHADAIRYLAPNLEPALHASFSERYSVHYLSGDAAIPLFNGVREMLTELVERGFLLGIATGKTRRGLARALAQHGIAHHFAASRCADEGFPKPHPDMLQALMDCAGVEPVHTLMIGDTTHDLALARNARVDAVAVAYGAHAPEGLAKMAPLATLHSIAELRAWLTANG